MCSGTSKYCLKRTTASSIADQSQFLSLRSGGSWHYTGRMLRFEYFYDSFFRMTDCTSTLPVASAGTRHAEAVVCVCVLDLNTIRLPAQQNVFCNLLASVYFSTSVFVKQASTSACGRMPSLFGRHKTCQRRNRFLRRIRNRSPLFRAPWWEME